jgi:hypothetical protein
LSGFLADSAYTTDNTFWNEVSYGNYDGFTLGTNAGSSTWINSIVYGNTNKAWRTYSGATAPTENHNLINGTTDISLNGTDLTSDPLFVDAPNADFRLTAFSPARNAGVDVGITIDAAGNAMGLDLGIYQTQGSAVASTLLDGVNITGGTIN